MGDDDNVYMQTDKWFNSYLQERLTVIAYAHFLCAHYVDQETPGFMAFHVLQSKSVTHIIIINYFMLTDCCTGLWQLKDHKKGKKMQQLIKYITAAVIAQTIISVCKQLAR